MSAWKLLTILAVFNRPQYSSSYGFRYNNLSFTRLISSNIPKKMSIDDRGVQQVTSEQCLSTSWLERIEISIAKSRKIKGGNYVQIATVDENGLPHCRTVVFRGFLKGLQKPNGLSTLALKMITDMRSEKVTQISSFPACEMVWWFSQSSEQFRISGTLQIISENSDSEELKTERKQLWGNLSDPGREQFYWYNPGDSFHSVPAVPTGGRDTEGKVLSPPSTFALLLLHPTSVKYLRLSDNLALLEEVSSQGDWLTKRVNP